MQLKSEIIERINGRIDLKRRLVDELSVHRQTLWRWLDENIEDGPLTKIKPLGIISESLNVPVEDLLVSQEHVNA